MLELLLGIYFSYKNALIAKAKGLNTIIWVVLTLLAFIAGAVVGGFILVGLFYHGPMNDQKALNEYFLQLNPLNMTFIYFSAIGGCLFIRYRLEKKQGILPPKVEEDQNESENYN